jgi:transposase-like protein
MSKSLAGDSVRLITVAAARKRRHAVLKLYQQHDSYQKVGTLLGISKQRVQVMVKRAQAENVAP